MSDSRESQLVRRIEVYSAFAAVHSIGALISMICALIARSVELHNLRTIAFFVAMLCLGLSAIFSIITACLTLSARRERKAAATSSGEPIPAEADAAGRRRR